MIDAYCTYFNVVNSRVTTPNLTTFLDKMLLFNLLKSKPGSFQDASVPNEGEVGQLWAICGKNRTLSKLVVSWITRLKFIKFLYDVDGSLAFNYLKSQLRYSHILFGMHGTAQRMKLVSINVPYLTQKSTGHHSNIP